MSFLYVTSDRIGQANHGGGNVTANEVLALSALGSCEIWGREQLEASANCNCEEPWRCDEIVGNNVVSKKDRPLKGWWEQWKLAHFYAGTFTKTVINLKHRPEENGGPCKITYTCAAHDKDLSRQEHERLGLPYPYPHLVEPELWQRYLRGYLEADVLIVPSQLSKRVMESYGAKNRIEVIPHGITIPDENCLRPLPKTFTVGYLGAFGADKGIPYLLEAWKKLNYKEAVLKLAGGNSHSPWADYLVSKFGGGNISCLGWIDDVFDFYNSISVLVQPSVSEGFGLEVLEAMAYGRPVLCSTGAGAADVVPLGPGLSQFRVKACNSDELAEAIDCCRSKIDLAEVGRINRRESLNYSWEIIRERYANVWRELLGEKQ